MVRVLVVEDSPTVRALLVAILTRDADIEVVGVAPNGERAVEMAARLRPDVVTMDIHMPEMDGLEATRRIMIETPVPIVIVSSSAPADVELSLTATRAGALTVLPTPFGPGTEGFLRASAELVSMVKAMSEVKVVRRWPHGDRSAAPRLRPADMKPRAVGIAASTGGPAALQRILSKLPRNFPVPIFVTQHIAASFISGLNHWLELGCELRVNLAIEGETVRAGTVYLAPDDRHLGVRAGRISLTPRNLADRFCPSADVMFDSLAAAYGSATLGVILTGMGSDGVDGLRAVRQAGGRVIAQDEHTSVVYGMPKEAVAAGVVDEVVSLEGIAPALVQLVQGVRP